MDIKELLCEEIQDDLNHLKTMDVGSDAFKTTVDGITKLTDRTIELMKLEAEDKERDEKRQLEREKLDLERDKVNAQKEELELKRTQIDEESKNRVAEYDLKLKSAEEEKKDRLIKNCLTAASIVLPIWITVWGTYKTFEFEKTGTITTMMGRGFIGKLLLPKK